MKRIKIAFIIDTIESPFAGTERQLLLLIERLDRDRFDPHLFVLYDSRWLRDEFNACPLHVLNIRSFKKIGALAGLRRLVRGLREQRIDIVQTHFRNGNIVGIIGAVAAGRRCILSSRRNQGYWLNARERLVQKMLNPAVTGFVANSKDTRTWVCRQEGVLPEKVRVIYNGIDLTAFDSAMAAADSRKTRVFLGLDPHAPLVVMVANLRPVKGCDLFVRAAKIVSDTHRHVQFLIAGEGTERPRLAAMIQDMGLSGQVHLPGRIRDIGALLGAADLGVLSSHSESFSNSVMEYLAAGLPVVCTRTGGLPEAVEDERGGDLVPAGDDKALAEAISRLVARPDLAKKMGARNRARARRLFAAEKMVRRFEECYVQCCRR